MIGKLVWKLGTSRLGFLAAGAGLVYFLDPDKGARRRNETMQKAQKTARQETNMVVGGAQRLQGEAKRKTAGKAGAGRFTPESEADLREHLRMVVHSLPFATTDVTVDVEEGVVGILGQVESEEQRTRIREALQHVDGVIGLRDFMFLPGSTAPNKAEVLRVG